VRTTGRTILITGGAGGIGIELARKFLSLGNTVIACGRSEDRLAAARDRLPDLVTFACDITDLDSVERLAEFLETEHPTLDTVINNAAVTHHLDFHDADVPAAIRSDVDTNIMGVVNVSWRLLPLLEQNPEACLAVVTSGIAYAPAHDVPGYSLTKAAMNSLCRSLRWSLRDRVRVVEIVPPAVDTDMVAGLECKKMSPVKVAENVVRGFEKDKPEIRMGETHVSHILNRVWPNGAQRLIRASFD
jgi:uncharacterized oxidoreductase